MASEETDSRIAYLEEKLAGKPDSFFFLPLAYGYLEGGRLEEAEETCAAGLQARPHFTAARALLGYIHHLRKDDHGAEEELARVVDEDPRNPLAHRLLGKIYAQKGEPIRAIEEYRKALALRFGDQEAAEALKELEEEHGDLPSTDPSGPVEGEKDERFYIRALADIYMREGAVDEALAIFSGLLEEEPEDHQARERVSELQALLAEEASENEENEEAGTPAGRKEANAFTEHLEWMEEDLKRMSRLDRSLTAAEARRAVEAWGELLDEMKRGEPGIEGEVRNDQDTGD